MVTHIDLELRRVKKERDIYRQAIIDFISSDMYGNPHDPRSIAGLVNALGKKRMKK